ncbi:hypothetical protein ABXV18_21585 [Vibrio owensii]|uniref:hypothetical protein n=1 Tax=Vibrio owensii TaxID=696485 RepID=UPI003396C737
MSSNVYIVSKENNSENWSTSIDEQKKHIVASRLFGKRNVSITYLPKSFLRSLIIARSILKNNPDLILVHHTICLWPFYISSFCKEDTKIVSFLHEGEIAFKNKYSYSSARSFISSFLRSSYYYHKLPQRVSDKTYVLTDFQIRILKLTKAEQINFLGVNPIDCPPMLNESDLTSSGNHSRTGFFPFSPSRPEKGFFLLERLTEICNISYPNNLSNDKMWSAYRASDFVIISSLEYETYSLALIEAMASNKFIIASRKLGLVHNLLKLQSVEYYKKLGLYIVDPNEREITKAVIAILDVLESGNEASTLSIFIQNQLDLPSVTKNIVSRIIKDV